VNTIHRGCNGDDAEGYFIIRQMPDRNWSVITPDRRLGGLFSTADDAHRFARTEARNTGHAEVITIGDVGVDIEVFDDSHLGKSLHVDYEDAGAAPRQEDAR
jgi:hypothetical protein